MTKPIIQIVQQMEEKREELAKIDLPAESLREFYKKFDEFRVRCEQAWYWGNMDYRVMQALDRLTDDIEKFAKAQELLDECGKLKQEGD